MPPDKQSGFCIPFEVKQTTDKGLGVFATAPVPKGSIVWCHKPGQYTVYDETTFMNAIQHLSDVETHDLLSHVFAQPEFPNCLIHVTDAGALINHAAPANVVTNNSNVQGVTVSPNAPSYLAEVTQMLLSETYALIAARNISEGEEVTVNYLEDGYDPPFYAQLCAQYGVDESYLDEPD